MCPKIASHTHAHTHTHTHTAFAPRPTAVTTQKMIYTDRSDLCYVVTEKFDVPGKMKNRTTLFVDSITPLSTRDGNALQKVFEASGRGPDNTYIKLSLPPRIKSCGAY
jgi:hypothetical protein